MKRISILVLIPCVCFVSVAWGEQQACTAYTPWAQFHKLNMRRWNRCEKVLGVNNVGRLGLKWSYPAGSQLDSSPAVVSGVVFFGSFFGNVYALKAKTGGLLWSYTTGGYVDSSPAVANGVVYVGSEDGNVYGLKAATGAKLWSYHTGNFVASSPAVVNRMVYVGSQDNNVYAFGL